MSVIFDLRNESEEWAEEINKSIVTSFPNYFDKHPEVGSEEWWLSISLESSNGRITHLGPLLEEGELLDVVVIEPLDDEFNSNFQPEYMIQRHDYWLHETLAVDKLVETESITLLPSGELDETSIYIETRVRVW